MQCLAGQFRQLHDNVINVETHCLFESVSTMIIHADMDAFYASVEQRDDPSLRGKSVIVGGSAEGRGVVCAASYEARKFGVHSAMAAATAKRLCPDGVFLPPRMDHYAKIARQIREIFHSFTPLVEPLSLDEAFLDASGSEALFGPSAEIGRQLKRSIREKLDLVVSVGVAPNKFLAKLASDLDKPDGFVVVDPDKVQEFLDPLSIGRIWGIGKKSLAKFESIGIRTVRDLRLLPIDTLTSRFGKRGRHLWELAQGIDARSVVPDRIAKSISHESTFPADIEDGDAIRGWVLELTEQVARRLRRNNLKGKTVHLKVRFNDFRTIVRSQTLDQPTSVTQQLWLALQELLASRLPDRHPPVRLLGVGVSGFDSTASEQMTLFDEVETGLHERLDEATDLIRDRFGASSVGRASQLVNKNRRPSYPKLDDEQDT